jgi:hypothetical protein
VGWAGFVYVLRVVTDEFISDEMDSDKLPYTLQYVCGYVPEFS